jgi:hypothetical protein
MVCDESTVVVQKRGNVGEEELRPVDAIRGPIAFEMIAEAHLQGLHEHIEGEKHWWKLDLVARAAGVAHALQLGHLQIQQLHYGRLPFLVQRAGYGCFGRGPMDLLEDAVKVGREGIEDAGAQAVRDGVDVVEQLGRGTFSIVLQAGQAGVQGAQLFVRLQRGLARRVELRLGVFAARTSADGGRRGGGVVLPEYVDVGEQLDIAARNVEAVQLVEGRLEARDGLLGRIAGGDNQQAAVDVGLLATERVRLLLELRVVGMGIVLCVVEVFLRGIDLLLQEALLLGDARQQCLQVARLDVGGRLQLVVEIGGDAVAVRHVCVYIQVRGHAGGVSVAQCTHSSSCVDGGVWGAVVSAVWLARAVCAGCGGHAMRCACVCRGLSRSRGSICVNEQGPPAHRRRALRPKLVPFKAVSEQNHVNAPCRRPAPLLEIRSSLSDQCPVSARASAAACPCFV